MRISDWSSDVCSSDLLRATLDEAEAAGLDTTIWGEAVDTVSTEEIDARQAEAASAIEAPRDAGAVQSRRAAVLEGLSGLRSDRRRVGKEWVSTCRYRWLP